MAEEGTVLLGLVWSAHIGFWLLRSLALNLKDMRKMKTQETHYLVVLWVLCTQLVCLLSTFQSPLCLFYI